MRNYYKCMSYAYPQLTQESNKPTYVYLHNEITVPEEIIDLNPKTYQVFDKGMEYEPVSEPSPPQPTTLRRQIPSQTSQDASGRTVERITLTGGGGTLTTYGDEPVPFDANDKTYQVFGHYTQACTVRAKSPEEALELSQEVDDWDYLADPEMEVREVVNG